MRGDHFEPAQPGVGDLVVGQRLGDHAGGPTPGGKDRIGHAPP